MLNPTKSSESTHIILSVIKELTGDMYYANFTGIVTAKVRDKIEIDEAKIEVHLTNYQPSYARIDISWEEYGYKDYKQKGLYGRMSTGWCEVKKTGPKVFTIYSDTYEIAVNYAGNSLETSCIVRNPKD